MLTFSTAEAERF